MNCRKFGWSKFGDMDEMHISYIFTISHVNHALWAGQLKKDFCKNITIWTSSHFYPHHQMTSMYSYITIDVMSIHDVIPCSPGHFSWTQHHKTKKEKKRKYRNIPSKSNSWLKSASHPNDVGECKLFHVPCAGGADCSTMQMKSHIRLNSISLDVTILPFFIWNSEWVQ